MGADKVVGGLLHLLLIEFVLHPPGLISFYRKRRIAIDDAVEIVALKG